MPSWSVLYIQSRYEFKVEQQLQKLGIRHFLPKIQVRRNWSDRVKKMLVPAFPSYLFVCIEPKDRNAVFQVKGVLHYVRHDQKDAQLKEEDINLLRASESQLIPSSFQPLQKLKGQLIKIRSGILAGRSGMLVDFLGKKTVQLKLEQISLGFLIEMPLEDLQIA
jgi:transcription antitermination factor NusG